MSSLVAVTGATGFVGSHLVEALVAAGRPTRAVVRDPARAAGLPGGVEIGRADLGDLDALTGALRGATTLVANAALGSYLGDLDAFLHTNVVGTENSLRAAAAAGVRQVVLVSSVAVYRTRVRAWLTEDAERYGSVRRRSWSDLTTDWRYALSKHLAEERAWALARELGLELVVLRPGPIYGSRDTRWTARLLRMASRRIVFAPAVGVPMVHVGDVAAAIVAAVGRAELTGRAFTLAGPPEPLPALLGTLRRLTGRGPLVVPIPVPLWVGYDTSAARDALGFRARSSEAGLREVVEGTPGLAPP